MRKYRSRISSILTASFIAVVATAAAAQQSDPQQGIPVHNLGDRDQNKIYPLTLTAQNLNCNSAQDFRFDLTEAPWIIALQDPVVRQIPPGGQGSTPAQLNFANSAPGLQESLITIICETCGYIPFVKNCRADRQQVILRVNIIPQPQPVAPEPTMPPEHGQQPITPSPQPQSQAQEEEIVGLDDLLGPSPVSPPADDGECPVEVEDVKLFQPSLGSSSERFLNGGQKKTLDGARKAASDAAAAVTAANEITAGLKKKKDDCQAELVRLRAEQAQKEAAADAAEAAADAAQQAVNDGPAKDAAAAQKKVDDFQNDVDAAQREYDRWTEAAQAQQDYLEIVIDQEGGLSSKRGQNAKQYYEEAAANREAARKNLAEVKNSMAARQAALKAAQKALEAAQKAADAKKAAAEAARNDANAAKDAADAKERECLGLEAQIKKAEDDAKKAAAAAAAANKAAAEAEKKATAQAVKNLEDAIKCKKDECERIKKMWDEHFRRLTNAKKALEQIGYYGKQAAAKGASSGKTSAEAWSDYNKHGLKNFLKDLAKATGKGVAEGIAPGTGPLVLLDALEAAYGIAGIRQSALTPGTYAHGRTEGAELRNWLIKNNLAHDDQGQKDAHEVEKQMERLMKDPNVIAKDLARAITQLEECKKQLAELEAKLAAAKGR
jgi:hypothetical protein